MDFAQLVKNNRSRRRFRESVRVERSLLEKLVSLARYTPSARNMQPLKFKIVDNPELCSKVFSTLSWAGYLGGWEPAEGERPSAYIVICNDSRLSDHSQWDQGITAQTLMLGAVSESLGGCIIATIRKAELSQHLSLAPYLEPVLVLALGYPIEEVEVVDVHSGDVKYYRDSAGVHYVPKRKEEELLIQ